MRPVRNALLLLYQPSCQRIAWYVGRWLDQSLPKQPEFLIEAHRYITGSPTQINHYKKRLLKIITRDTVRRAHRELSSQALLYTGLRSSPVRASSWKVQISRRVGADISCGNDNGLQPDLHKGSRIVLAAPSNAASAGAKVWLARVPGSPRPKQRIVSETGQLIRQSNEFISQKFGMAGVFETDPSWRTDIF